MNPQEIMGQGFNMANVVSAAKGDYKGMYNKILKLEDVRPIKTDVDVLSANTETAIKKIGAYDYTRTFLIEGNDLFAAEMQKFLEFLTTDEQFFDNLNKEIEEVAKKQRIKELRRLYDLLNPECQSLGMSITGLNKGIDEAQKAYRNQLLEWGEWVDTYNNYSERIEKAQAELDKISPIVSQVRKDLQELGQSV